ncbi:MULTISPECIES: cupin domain-containing protein [Dyella]|uniref:AraC family transcriptional regulator n=2 Tax=Dyella TaxID=231454 RepID=A0A4R0YJ27_9GAMM|nr:MULTISPECIES: cupin domain-containing protein [Dyella]TBR36489.1 AraC family transcriptional regulator [Dyella terrae]TCI08419.1 AraC family transcriptional regulator [Dyella soli]
MDALSSVIDLAAVQGSLDLRCQLAGRFDIPHDSAGPGEAPFHLVLAGTARLQVRGKPDMTLKAGDFVLLPRGAAHTLYGLGEADAMPMMLDSLGALPERRNTDGAVELDLLCGRFTYASGTTDLLMHALPDVLHVSLTNEGAIDALNGIVAILRHEVALMRPGALAVVTALSQALFVMALRTYSQHEAIPSSLLGLLSHPRLSAAILAMIRSPHENWTVETLAARANMSRATFARQFSEKGGMSPIDLLTTMRMQLACNLLSSTDLALATVAERIGYLSESAFTKAFRKRVGVTPSAYRRSRH